MGMKCYELHFLSIGLWRQKYGLLYLRQSDPAIVDVMILEQSFMINHLTDDCLMVMNCVHDNDFLPIGDNHPVQYSRILFLYFHFCMCFYFFVYYCYYYMYYYY